jgi:hypothetical protein
MNSFQDSPNESFSKVNSFGYFEKYLKTSQVDNLDIHKNPKFLKQTFITPSPKKIPKVPRKKVFLLPILSVI